MKSRIIENNDTPEKGILEEVLGSIEGTTGFGGFEEIASMLSLPDEQFELIKEPFLSGLEKSLSDPNDKMYLIQSMNATGTKAEDLVAMKDELMKEIDEQLSSILTPSKCDLLKRVLMMTITSVVETEGIAKRIVQIPIELCHENAKIPVYAHLTDAGADLVALEDITLAPGERKIIPTGIKVAVPNGYAILIQPRSGLSAKSNLRIANTPGLIDSGYRGELGVIMENIAPYIEDMDYGFDDNHNIVIKSILHGAAETIGKGQKFAQVRLVEVPKAAFFEVSNIGEINGDERGEGGFGSSDEVKTDEEN